MYDPVVSQHTPSHCSYPESYWATTVSTLPLPTLQQEVKADIAIIGGGYTGLSAAYRLAHHYGKSVVLLEANKVGWGCSGRNGGFALPGSGRLSVLQMQKKWGTDTAHAIHRQYQLALDTVQSMIESGNIDCDMIQGGYLKIAHTAAAAENMRQQVSQLGQEFGENLSFLTANELHERLVKPSTAFGGVYYPDCFAVNPLKLAIGYSQMAQSAGAALYANSAVTGWQSSDGGHLLHTEKGSVAAKQVIIASNGYTPRQLHNTVDNRHFPVLSSILVTDPLTKEQQQAIGIHPGLMAMDTRALKYYYRLLPDGRLLFGGRGAIYGKDANKQLYRKRLLKALSQTFPQLSGIDARYFWSGWVSVALDSYPRIIHNQDTNIGYAMGYCGSGLTFSCQAGHWLADKMMGQLARDIDQLPLMQSPLPTYPMVGLRRMGLLAYYLWHSMLE